MKNSTILKGILWLLLGFLLYMIVGGAVVPLFRPDRKPAPQVDLQNVGTGSERVLCIDDNQQALLWRLRVIDSAKENILFATFKFQDDESGRDIMAALLHAAEQGVHVRMVVDGFSVFTCLRHNDRFDTLVAHPNVELKIYNPVNFLKPWALNYRMHDKYIVADETSYILGGRNTQNVSLGEYQQDRDLDRDVLVYGVTPDRDSSLQQVKAYFEQMWSLPDVQEVSEKSPNLRCLQELQEHYKQLKKQYPEAYMPISWAEKTYPTNGIRLIHNELGAANKSPILWDTLMDLMSQGNSSLIETPYLMCNKEMYRDLTALQSSGRTNQILTNSVETGANLCGCIDYLNEKHNILKTGMPVYEYVGANSSHAKTVLLDDRVSVVGSFNFDMRSTYLDTETMLVIDSPELTAHLEELARQRMDSSRKILPDQTVEYGPDYREVKPGILKMAFYQVMRIVVLPFRHLL